jgi:hypothetical protein
MGSNPEELIITASKTGGARTYNRVEFRRRNTGALWASGTLLDANGDRRWDSVRVQLEGTPPTLIDRVLEFYSKTGGGTYLVIPPVKFRIARPRLGENFGPRTPYRVFVPVGTASLQVECGGTPWGEVVLTASGDGAEGYPIPTLSEWGVILTTILLLAAGIWALRKTRFSADIGLV